MKKKLDDTTALGIGLAAQMLPGATPQMLMQQLQHLTGGILSREALGKLTPCQVRPALQRELPDITGVQVKAALAVLRGEGEEARVLEPSTGSPPEPGRIRVACASGDGARLDGHFGATPRFVIYDVGPEGAEKVEERAMDTSLSGEEGTDRRLAWLRDCHMVWIASIGGPVAARVVRAGLLPVRFTGHPALEELLENLRQVLAQKPPPWLAKAMTVH